MILEKNRGEYAACRIPALIRTEAGALLAAYECRRGSDSDWAQIDIKISRSIDGGESWEQVLLIQGEGDTLNNPVFFTEGENVWLLFLKNYADLFVSVSRDGGKSFQEPQIGRAHV